MNSTLNSIQFNSKDTLDFLVCVLITKVDETSNQETSNDEENECFIAAPKDWPRGNLTTISIELILTQLNAKHIVLGW